MSILASLGSSLLESTVGGIFGAVSQNSANKANREINQMNNEFNERMMDKQIAYEKEMWQKNNEYNSASAQAERWKEAGFNPSMMMGNANAGVASSGSVSAASAAPSAPQQAFNPAPYVTGASQAIMEFAQLKQKMKLDEAAINEMNANADVARARAAADINESWERTKNWRIKNKYADAFENLTLSHLNSEIKQTDATADYYRTLGTLNTQEALLKSKELAIFDEKSRLELSSIAADIGLKYAQRELTAQQAKHELEKQLKTISETTGIKLNNNNLASMSAAIVEKAKQEAIRSGQPQNVWQGMSDAYGGFNSYIDDWIVKPSKKAWKDTKRHLGW